MDRLDQLPQILDTLPVFIGLVNQDQRYEFVNSTYEKRYELPREEIIGKTVEELNGSTEYEKSRDKIEAALKGEFVEFEYAHDNRYYLIKYLPRKEDGEVTGYFVISTDITQLKKTTIQLELNRAELNFTRSSFENFASFTHYDRIASVGAMAVGFAHDISQPISVMNILIDSLRSSLKGSIAEQSTRETVDNLQYQVQYTADLINRLRSFSTKQGVERARSDLNQILVDSLSMMSPRIRSNDIDLTVYTCKQPVEAIVDRIEVQQILVNLIVNAIESVTEKKEPPRKIKVISEVEEPGIFAYRVIDTGSGVSSEMIGKLFKAFESDKESGIGMGLSISRILAANNGGSLELATTNTSGAEFVCRLPIAINKSKS